MDPQRDGFQLVDATVVHLPQVIETFGLLQAKGTMLLAQKLSAGQDSAEIDGHPGAESGESSCDIPARAIRRAR